MVLLVKYLPHKFEDPSSDSHTYVKVEDRSTPLESQGQGSLGNTGQSVQVSQ